MSRSFAIESPRYARRSVFGNLLAAAAVGSLTCFGALELASGANNPRAVNIASPHTAPALAQADTFGGYASTHIVIRVKPGVTPAQLSDGRWTLRGAMVAQSLSDQIAGLAERRGVRAIVPTLNSPPKSAAIAQQLGLDRYFTIELPPRSDAQAVVAEFAAIPEAIESAQLDGIGGIAATIPNDPNFNLQWNLRNTTTPGADIDATRAWDITQGSNSVVLAILDTGVQHFDANVAGSSDHPDLEGFRILPGWSTYTNSSNTDDQHGHGTHVAGIAAAKGNNSIGVAGVNWHVKILPVQCVNPTTGSGSETQCANAVIWAADNGATIISMSLQYYTGNTVLRDAVAYAYDRGILPIAATGNWASAGTIAYPAKWPKCMGVGATDRFDARYVGSNTGPEIDVVAPGQDVYSTWRQSGYAYNTGTSMATPHVSGLAAMMKGVASRLTPPEIESVLATTADDKGAAGWDTQFGWGRINARKALLAVAPNIPGDTNGDHMVNIDDLFNVIATWGPCPPPGPSCPTDLNHNGIVNIDDLFIVINNWT